MKWASAISEARSLNQAIEELTQSIRSELNEGPSQDTLPRQGTLPPQGTLPLGGVDLAFLFVSPYFKNDYNQLPGSIYDAVGCKVLIGCSAGGVIGGGREVERRPALSMIAANLPGVSVKPFHINLADLPDLDASPKKWQDLIGPTDTSLTDARRMNTGPTDKPAPPSPHFVFLADPFTMDIERCIEGLDYAYPSAVKVGGLASGASAAGQNSFFVNKDCYRSGMVGVSLSGNIAIDTIVAQGCRPVGKPFSITRCDRNMVLEIDGQKPLDVLQNLYEELSEDDRKLIQHSLFMGLALTPFKEELSRGDFLIRNLIGVDQSTGAMALGTLLHEGQTGQFHLRDKETSAEDLKWHLTEYQMQKKAKLGSGALLFSCMGRGASLYGEPDFDTRLFQGRLGAIPLGGFFCNGEIGAVGQTTFLHGYTSCFGIFRPAS